MLKIDENHRYSWIKNQRSLLVSRGPATHLTPQNDQLMSECRAFSASSRLFDLNGQAKTARTKQSNADICALTLGDSFS